MAWARWFEKERREWQIISEVDCYRISTVFLGLDHNYTGVGPPILWETMVFHQADKEDDLHQHMARCAGGFEQAEAMHIRMVEHVKEQLAVENRDDGSE